MNIIEQANCVGHFFEKDKKKFKNCNKLIARGSAKSSSSNKYRIAAKSAANSSYYEQSDIVGVSVEGNRRGRVEANFEELLLAIKANATIVTDNSYDRNRSYNIGERGIEKFLLKNNYTESNGNGVWTSQLV